MVDMEQTITMDRSDTVRVDRDCTIAAERDATITLDMSWTLVKLLLAPQANSFLLDKCNIKVIKR